MPPPTHPCPIHTHTKQWEMTSNTGRQGNKERQNKKHQYVWPVACPTSLPFTTHNQFSQLATGQSAETQGNDGILLLSLSITMEMTMTASDRVVCSFPFPYWSSLLTHNSTFRAPQSSRLWTLRSTLPCSTPYGCPTKSTWRSQPQRRSNRCLMKPTKQPKKPTTINHAVVWGSRLLTWGSRLFADRWVKAVDFAVVTLMCSDEQSKRLRCGSPSVTFLSLLGGQDERH